MAEPIKVILAVLDTNIFLRSLIRKGNISDKIFSHWKDDDFLLVASNEIFKEVEEILKRPKNLKSSFLNLVWKS